MKKLKQILLYKKRIIFLIFFLVVYVIYFTNLKKYNSLYNYDTTQINGIIKSYNIDGDKLKIEINSKEDIVATYYIKSKEEKENLSKNISIGDEITIYGSIKENRNNTIPNTFNYKKYLQYKHIYYSFQIDNFKLEKTNNIFYKAKDYLFKRAIKIDKSGYLLLFILGDKSLITNEEYNTYNVNGVSHLLAISGMHIGVILKILDLLLKRLELKKKSLIISSILLFFAFLTDFSSSILRAVLFYIILSLKKIFKWKISNLELLIYCAAFLIIINPFIIYDIGFLYSFIISGGIILNNKYIKGNYFKKILIISFISTMFSLPITLSINYEINIMSIFTNIIFVPLISIVVYPFALITFIFSFMSPLFNIIISFLTWLNNIASNFSIMIIFGKVNILFLLLYYAILISLPNKKIKIFIIICYLLFIRQTLYFDSSCSIYYLDVGQGDSALIVSPHKEMAILIDTGGKIEYEKEEWQEKTKKYNDSDNIIKFIKSLGINKIDYLVITHGDFDHMGEAINLVNNFKIKSVIFNCGPHNNLENKLIKVLDKNNIKHYSCIRDLDIDNYKLEFLNTKIYDNENDNSNVIYFNYNNYKFLFMGDAGVDKEKDILEKYNLKDIDFLKVGHHGSNTSSSKEFINIINPKYSLISVGKNNRYGHPKESVLVTLSNSKIYRTDIDGSLEILINKKEYKVRTFPP